jgi:hypothetical protein
LERRAAVADSHERQALTRDLVNGLDDEACLVRRAEVMGFRIESPHVVCLLSADGDPGSLCVGEAEAAWAGIGQTEPIWATTAPLGGLALIIELDDDVARAAALVLVQNAVERLRLQLEPERHVLAAVLQPLPGPCRLQPRLRRGHAGSPLPRQRA